MKLFHGTDLFQAQKIIEEGVDLKAGRKYLDFGQGFYLTPSFQQAVAWASRKSAPCVLEFDLSTNGLVIKQFESANLEWAAFVVDNRLHLSYSTAYDCIVGPMADAGVSNMYLLYKMRKLTREQAIRKLVGRSNGLQEALLNEKAVRALTFIRKVVL